MMDTVALPSPSTLQMHSQRVCFQALAVRLLALRGLPTNNRFANANQNETERNESVQKSGHGLL